MKDDLKSKQLVLKLVFESKIIYNREIGFGTAKLSLPLRVFELNELGNSYDVDYIGLYWDQIVSELYEWNKIMTMVS
jgi:hypothetical protein